MRASSFSCALASILTVRSAPRRARKLAWLAAALLLAATALAAQSTPPLKAGELSTMRFRFIGPTVGNRVAAVAGVPGNPNVYYAGAASGGIYKTTDGGNRWQPIFDHEPVAAIGALAVAPSNPSIVWAGTGEAWMIRPSDVMGNGVYRSLDAGKTWTHLGLDATGRIGRIVVNPQDPNIVFVCALGRGTGPQQQRGVFRTLDGGKNWQRVLFADENTGCSGLSMDAHDSNTLFAGMWQVVMHTWGEFSGGPGSGIYVSHDGGTSWQRLTGHGLPHSPLGKIDVAVAPSDGERVYALIQTKDQGSVWRSDDGGANWRVVNWNRELIGRAGYYIRLAVSPANENEVLLANSSFFDSTDGGMTFHQVPWGGDNHDIWIDPTNADRFAISDDGGVNLTTQHGRSMRRISLPIGQMYHVAVDDQIPYDVYSNMQDAGTMRGPSTSFGFAFGRRQQEGWDFDMGGCESGFTLPDPADPNVVWASCYGDEVTRWDARSKLARSVSPWFHTLDSTPSETKYRCHWTPPLAIDPFDPNTIYYGCQVIFKTSNGGQSWTVISPDLSTHDPSKLVSSGGLSGDNLGQFYDEVVFAIAPSSLQKGLIWAGTNDGQVWYTRDGGGHWNNVTRNIPDMPATGVVTSIEPSHFSAGTAYVSVDHHLDGTDDDPYIYKTTDYGRTWTAIGASIPAGPLHYVKDICEDPYRPGLLFAGTGSGLFFTLDDGQHWMPLQSGLPHTTVTWAVVQKRFHDLVISTYGRGLYILDDITPLERMTAADAQAPLTFFAPRPAYRLLPRPPRAIFDYYLASAAKKPVEAEILDAQGHTVRSLRVPGRAGLNRIEWDMRYAPPRLIQLRTDAPDNSHIWEEARFRGAKWRPITHWGIAPAEAGPLAAPGRYTVRLTADGVTRSQPLTILRDPHSPATDADVVAEVQMQLRIRADIDKVSAMVNQIEWSRKQLGTIGQMLEVSTRPKDLLASVRDINAKMQSVEYQLINRVEANSDDKYYEDEYKVYLNLIWLNGEVGTGAGDVAGGAGFAPTDTEAELLDMIEAKLAAATRDYQNLMSKEVLAFNRSLAEHNLTPLVLMPAKVAAVSGGQ
ncbi:MAG: WD40/YVTN/BNR-like repeat-containing protein [Terriglobales bacterium]